MVTVAEKLNNTGNNNKIRTRNPPVLCGCILYGTIFIVSIGMDMIEQFLIQTIHTVFAMMVFSKPKRDRHHLGLSPSSQNIIYFLPYHESEKHHFVSLLNG